MQLNVQLTVGGPCGEPGSHVLYHVGVVFRPPVDHAMRPPSEELIVKGLACVLDLATKENVLVNEPP